MQCRFASVDRRPFPRGIALALLVCCAGCRSAGARVPHPFEARRELLGTEFAVAIVDADALRGLERARAALDAAEDVARVLDRWDESSELALLNRDSRTGWVDASCALVDALEVALDAHAATGGAFDVRIASALRGYGYYGVPGPNGPQAVIAGLDVPLAAELRVQREPCRVWRARAFELDCGGFAKGLAVRRAVERLRELGVSNALVQGGASSVHGLGAGPDGDGWPYAPPPELDVRELRLFDRAVSVSQQHSLDDARAREGSLILDPSSGRLVPPATVLVLGTDAALADLWSTALVAAAPNSAFGRLGSAWRCWRAR